MIQIFKLSQSCFEIEKLIIGYYLEFVFCYLKFLIIYSGSDNSGIKSYKLS